MMQQDNNSEATCTLVVDTMYRLAQALTNDTKNAMAAGKSPMLKHAITSALGRKNDTLLGLVHNKCYDLDDAATLDVFDAFVETCCTEAVPVASQKNVYSYLFAIPVSLARTCNQLQPDFVKDVDFDSFEKSVIGLFPSNSDHIELSINPYLYHPAELMALQPSELFGLNQALVNVQSPWLDPIENRILLGMRRWPPCEPKEGLELDLFFLIGSVRTETTESSPLAAIDLQTLLTWRRNSSELLERCLSLKADEGFVILGDMAPYQEAIRKGSVEHKELVFDIEVENLILRDKLPPQSLSVLFVQFGDDDFVERVHVSIVGVLDHAVHLGYSYGLEPFEQTTAVINNMLETLEEWGIHQVQVMETVLAYDEAFNGDAPVYLMPEIANPKLLVVDSPSGKTRLLH